MKVKIKDGYLVIRIPLEDLPLLVDDGFTQPKSKPKPIVHTPECISLKRRELLFDRDWPIHCRTCAAKGYIPGAEGQKCSCPRCLEFGICPRCGNSALAKISTEDGTFVHCGNENCEWDQREAMMPSAEAAGMIAPVWRCNCEKEEQDATV